MSYINKETIDLFILFYQPMYDDSEKKIIAGFFIKETYFTLPSGIHIYLEFILFIFI